jgi:phosphatidylserine decarboxylase
MEIFISSMVLALVFLPLLAWKWRVKAGTAIVSAIVIGGLTGLLVSWIHSVFTGLNIAALISIELALIVLLTCLAIAARFYRDPERSPQENVNVILSPADGKVVYINRVEPGSSLVATKGQHRFKLDEITSTALPANAAYLIGIEMNVLNVHVNRSPISGKVILCQRTRGKFLSLRKLESEAANERVTTVIGNGAFEVGIVQISSRLVRKIVSYIREGDSLDIGQRLGAIVFGSQVDVVIPALEHLRIEVKAGDEVKAGISVMARHHLPEDSRDIVPAKGEATSI